MTAKVAINGFGRIGRMVCRKIMDDPTLEVVAVNASYPAETLAHLLKYDTIHGPLSHEVEAGEDELFIDGQPVKITKSRDPKELPWAELGIDIVIEATGKFKDRETAGWHLDAGAKKVLITAPGKEEDATIVMGVNEKDYNPEKHDVLSNASCTTNCLAPAAKVLHDNFGIETGMMTTVHAYTNDQQNLDNPHKDLRRARACGQSIIPTSTGAAKAISKVLPELEGRMHGMALRVPTPNVSLVDLVVDVEKDVTAEEVNQAFQKAAAGEMQGILGYSGDPLVSIDYNGDENSSIIDGLSTMVLNDRQVKVLAWYDNEWGYSCRVVDLAHYVAEHLHTRQSA
ncbi:glyceraldehyde-3-phosphate dehydrogenase (NAD+) [Salsuginibacillus halophilus]|uniref:Glyceraldehyde-3-phosphate dehydrogenase n=1 Tax=Salsuginibacillus halophilus TaxID=517424 RepID=A0A2P8HD21_9BACI|nr:glyceraldehyde-3-phosphate dehydrogenase [Salsuginibacillus halophilus]PSL44062.1 glyceraldehyde-3-phosphate dehydrogenase (NAD+) [Salsuginibacillus halophilus]